MTSPTTHVDVQNPPEELRERITHLVNSHRNPQSGDIVVSEAARLGFIEEVMNTALETLRPDLETTRYSGKDSSAKSI